MATPAQIEVQVNLERGQIRKGLEQFRNETKKLEDKSYSSATVYGKCSIVTLLPFVFERIEQTAHRIKELSRILEQFIACGGIFLVMKGFW